jgi:hypothetical protein
MTLSTNDLLKIRTLVADVAQDTFETTGRRIVREEVQTYFQGEGRELVKEQLLAVAKQAGITLPRT